MNFLYVTLVAIFFPGILATLIVDIFTHHKDWDNFRYGYLSLVFGFSSYLILQILSFIPQVVYYVYCYGMSIKFTGFNILSFWNIASSDKIHIEKWEVIAGSFISVFLGLMVSLAKERKVIHKCLNKFVGLNYQGNQSAFLDGIQYLIDNYSDEYGNTRLQIRLVEDGLIVDGYLCHYFESASFQEVSLSNATITNEDGKYQYHTNYHYICKPTGKITIHSSLYTQEDEVYDC